MQKNNAKCDICGKEYIICSNCMGGTKYRPWRNIVDTLPHYAIFLALSEYTATKNKVNAKKALDKCDLSGLNTFNPNIKKTINEIYAESKVTVAEKKTVSKAKAIKEKNNKEEK